ncbi:NYN domain-containing protein [Sphaerisporangium sp. TRM90804]|uniref:NYN domain-containing protein n=1 Tax=Sphaerisporangium sp. TRM90804 TaxID=3031113 RepID=UPI002448EDB4|nr:NYN domain-containing protein [Sphaerisporangium sp. TRM90804]MDH2423898.1 NYN domain-containing protein [Sphaerisporangium sp. TRM90804]
MITNVYVDGFNLYYGCLKGTPYKWLDLEALAVRLLPHNRINRIRYYTACIAPREEDPAQHLRQELYLRALAANPVVSIHLGRFQVTTARMRLARPPVTGPKTAEVLKVEEKGSDVNLATHLLADAFRKDCRAAVVISNDADLAEPVRLVCHELRLPVGIVNPHRVHRRSVSLERVSPTFFRQIRPSVLKACQLPEKVMDGQGAICRPESW